MEDAIKDQDATRVDRDFDATIIARPLSDKKPVDSASAEFIPPDGARATGEITSVWADRPRRLPALWEISRQWLSARFDPKRLALIGALAVLAATLLLFPLPRSQGSSTTQAVTDRKPVVDSAQLPSSIRNTVLEHETSRSSAVPTDKVTLRDAVESLISGRLDEAMEKYRQLHGIHPGDPSYGLAVELLERQLK
jgi:hypothetical protein